ncbi:uncharacterized protein TNCV_2013181 [Trichonephila clavipes]|nr:uncharacterized protein TNCV_2013181 [Trichonephila clavipes]
MRQASQCAMCQAVTACKFPFSQGVAKGSTDHWALEHMFIVKGAPAHFSIVGRNHLYATYPRRRIGRGEPVAWSPYSPELSRLDFFYWGHLKMFVHEMPVAEIKDRRRVS